ncbi:DUF6126 family protein [Streptomyces sp. NPDC058423]|uniref:DUF6126 family protein n=1 Tax=unclassified Streptomyces TaxID=2593676 RepID=UPI0036533BC0
MLRVFDCVFATHVFAGFVRLLFYGGQHAPKQRCTARGGASAHEEGRRRVIGVVGHGDLTVSGIGNPGSRTMLLVGRVRAVGKSGTGAHGAGAAPRGRSRRGNGAGDRAAVESGPARTAADARPQRRPGSF